MHALLLAAALAASAPPGLAVRELAPGVFAAITDTADPEASGNAGFVVGSDAVLVVDAFANEAMAERLLAEIRSRTKLPVRFAVLTHFHRDHVSGGAALAKAGAVLIGHENVRAWMRREWDESRTPERRALDAALRLPDLTFADRVTVDLGGRKVDVFHLPGHSGSDSVVSIPDAKVLFAGDLFSNRCVPGVRFARMEAWVATLDGLIQAHPDFAYVPGHGEPGRALQVRGFRDYVNGLRSAVARALADGKSGAALLETVKAQVAARYASWTWFDRVDGNIVEVEKELTGTKAYPPAPPR